MEPLAEVLMAPICTNATHKKLFSATNSISDPTTNREGLTFDSYFKVHSSAISDFLAPMVRSRRSVVARSASIPFSSWPIDLNPFWDRGSFSIARSFAFLRDSKNAVHMHLVLSLETWPLF